LRATFATLHSDAGTAPAEIQRMLRHKNITTTQRYIETGRRGLEAAQRKVAELMKLQPPKPEPGPQQKAKGNKTGNKKPSKPRQS
jgi:integrase